MSTSVGCPHGRIRYLDCGFRLPQQSGQLMYDCGSFVRNMLMYVNAESCTLYIWMSDWCLVQSQPGLLLSTRADHKPVWNQQFPWLGKPHWISWPAGHGEANPKNPLPYGRAIFPFAYPTWKPTLESTQSIPTFVLFYGWTDYGSVGVGWNWFINVSSLYSVRHVLQWAE